jgi:hypothetical protein
VQALAETNPLLSQNKHHFYQGVILTTCVRFDHSRP